MTTTGRLEVLVEPFRENQPGPHVSAVVSEFEARGLEVDMGPFATVVSGSLDELSDAIKPAVDAGFAAGATSVQARFETGSTVGAVGLHGALDRLIADAEGAAGVALGDMDRAQKQLAVRRLDELGAFLLRGAVEDLAARMDVSRVTLYSYLNATGQS